MGTGTGVFSDSYFREPVRLGGVPLDGLEPYEKTTTRHVIVVMPD